jgi:hypothetical protein
MRPLLEAYMPVIWVALLCARLEPEPSRVHQFTSSLMLPTRGGFVVLGESTEERSLPRCGCTLEPAVPR